MPPLPEARILVLASFAPPCSHRVWPHAQLLLVGARLAPGPRTVTAARRVMGLSGARHCTNDQRVLKRATWSARQASRILLGRPVTSLVPAGAPLVLGADDTGERRRGRQITAQGGDRDAVRSTRKHVIHGVGLTWVVMLRWVPVPWSRRVWALPLLTAWCRPTDQATQRRHQTNKDGVRQMMWPARRGLPGWPLVWVVDGGWAAGARAWACVQSQVTMVSRLRRAAVLDHPPGPQPRGKRGPQPTKGTRQRSLPAWAERSDTLWETVTVDWYRGQRQTLWVFSHTALWHTPGLPPVERCVWSSSAIPRGSCVWQRSAVPTCRRPRCTSWRGSSGAGRSRSPVRKPEPRWDWRPNASGRTWPSPAPHPCCWPCARSSPCWSCD